MFGASSVRTIIDHFLVEADAALPAFIRSFYLVGSIALDDYRPGGSDIDFIAVTPARLVSATVDAWCVDSLPHVLVGVQPYAVDVGPWVAPGVGPCARCVAAAVLDEGDRAAPGAVPRPLLALAAGAVARDLAAWSRSELPHTWLTSWRVDHDPVPAARRWQRHPYCGCAWFDAG